MGFLGVHMEFCGFLGCYTGFIGGYIGFLGDNMNIMMFSMVGYTGFLGGNMVSSGVVWASLGVTLVSSKVVRFRRWLYDCLGDYTGFICVSLSLYEFLRWFY